jgi:hypothetical protein
MLPTDGDEDDKDGNSCRGFGLGDSEPSSVVVVVDDDDDERKRRSACLSL